MATSFKLTDTYLYNYLISSLHQLLHSLTFKFMYIQHNKVLIHDYRFLTGVPPKYTISYEVNMLLNCYGINNIWVVSMKRSRYPLGSFKIYFTASDSSKI